MIIRSSKISYGRHDGNILSRVNASSYVKVMIGMIVHGIVSGNIVSDVLRSGDEAMTFTVTGVKIVLAFLF